MDWYDIPVFGHDGATLGQNAYLRIVPECDVVVALMTNGGSTDLLQSILFRELFEELASVRMPNAVFEPAPKPPIVDITPFIGIFFC